MLVDLLLDPRAVRALQQWCQLFCAARIPEPTISRLLDYVVRPLDKGGGRPRPIVLSELLLKLPMGCCVDAHRDRLQSLLAVLIIKMDLYTTVVVILLIMIWQAIINTNWHLVREVVI